MEHSKNYKVTLTGKTNKENLGNSVCVVPISHGQPSHNGDKFYESMLALNSIFGKLILLYTYPLHLNTRRMNEENKNKTDKEMLDELTREHKAWKEKNQHVIDLCSKKLTESHWDDWTVKNELYSEKKELIDVLYKEDKIFFKTVNNHVGKFLKGRVKNPQKFINDGKLDLEALEVKLVIDYILTECAQLLVMAENENPVFNYLAYPNNLSEPMYHVLRKFVYCEGHSEKERNDCLVFLRINLKEIKQEIPFFFSKDSKLLPIEKNSDQNKNQGNNTIKKLINRQFDLAIETLRDFGYHLSPDDIAKIMERIINTYKDSENPLENREPEKNIKIK